MSKLEKKLRKRNMFFISKKNRRFCDEANPNDFRNGFTFEIISLFLRLFKDFEKVYPIVEPVLKKLDSN